MAWIENKTVLEHKKFGLGTFKRIVGSHILVDFGSKLGEKKFDTSVILNEILKEYVISTERELENQLCTNQDIQEKKLQQEELVEPQNGEFNDSNLKIDGKNIFRGISTQNDLSFNETYVIIGEKLKAPKIEANYNLIVFSAIETNNLTVRGNLTVVGNITCEKLVCEGELICSGSIEVKEIIVGGNIIGHIIESNTIECGENLLTISSIDVDEKMDVSENILCGQGIYGEGRLSAKKVVAIDYVDFDGDIEANVISFNEKTNPIRNEDNLSVGMPEELLEVKDITDIGTLLYVIDKYNDFSDSIKKESKLEQLTNEVLPKALKNIELMNYKANSPMDIANAIIYIEKYKAKYNLDDDLLLDKVFQSIGIKYKTVASFLK